MKSSWTVALAIAAVSTGAIETTSADARPEVQIVGVQVDVELVNRRIFVEEVLPAYEVFEHRGDLEPLIALLRVAARSAPDDESAMGRVLDDQPALLLGTRRVLEDDIRVLEGRKYYAADGSPPPTTGSLRSNPTDIEVFVREFVMPGLIQRLCLPWGRGFPPKQDMSRSPLVSYLYAHSEWIMEVFTFERRVTGGVMKTQASEFFSSQELHRLRDEMARV